MDTPDVTRDLRCAYDALYEEAVLLAGEPDDITQRAAILYRIYHDSRGNHPFPLIVLHGALWADGFLRHVPRLVALLAGRYFYDRERQHHYSTVLTRFATGLKTINRQVFIDTYTNYYFTRQFGQRTVTSGTQPANLMGALVAMHEATRTGTPFDAVQQRELYLCCLRQEQEATVAPGVAREVARFTCPLLRRLCLRPPVRFAYFAPGVVFFFRNFAHKEERIARAIAAYDEAVRRGWPRVVASLADYRVLPPSFFADPVQFTDALVGWLGVAPEARPTTPPAVLHGLSSMAISTKNASSDGETRMQRRERWGRMAGFVRAPVVWAQLSAAGGAAVWLLMLAVPLPYGVTDGGILRAIQFAMLVCVPLGLALLAPPAPPPVASMFCTASRCGSNLLPGCWRRSHVGALPAKVRRRLRSGVS